MVVGKRIVLVGRDGPKKVEGRATKARATQLCAKIAFQVIYRHLEPSEMSVTVCPCKVRAYRHDPWLYETSIAL